VELSSIKLLVSLLGLGIHMLLMGSESGNGRIAEAE
jgi:hypothetical protein